MLIVASAAHVAYATINNMAKETTPEISVLRELEPVVEVELNRHLRQAKPWNPHDFVPWSDGENFAYLGGRDWEPGQSRLSEVGQTAMRLNLLTEDNLPSYHREITTIFGSDGPWGQWAGRWTAEEARHGTAMRDFLVVTRAIDPVKLEQDRMVHMTAGYNSGNKSPLEGVAYVTFQELATQISHRNTGRVSKRDGDVLADDLLNRIAQDEALHMAFYRNVGQAALEIDPNTMIQAIHKEVSGFAMPGAETIPDFLSDAMIMADAGIYDPDLHVNRVLRPIIKQWDIEHREDFTGEGARARDNLFKTLEKYERFAARFVAKREERKAATNV